MNKARSCAVAQPLPTRRMAQRRESIMNGYDYYRGGGGSDNGGNNTPPDYYDVYTELQLKEAKGTFSRFSLGLFIYLIASYAVIFAAELVLLLVLGEDGYYALAENIYFNWLVGVGPMYLVGFPLLFLMTKGMKKREYTKSKMSISELLIVFIVAKGAITVGSYVGQLLNSFISAVLGKDIVDGTSELIEQSPIWLTILIAVIIGPIIEELIFRKLMIDRLGRYGNMLAITVSAIAFGLFHGNFYQFFYAALLGFILGYVYIRTGNVIYSTVLHMIINFLGSVAVMPIIKAAERLTELQELAMAGGEFDFAELYRALTIVGSYEIVELLLSISGIIIGIKLLTSKAVKVSKECEYMLPKERTVSTVMLNTGTVLYIVLSLILFAVSIFLV